MLKPRSLFAVEDDGLIKELDFSDCEGDGMESCVLDLSSSKMFTSSPVKCSGRSPIKENISFSSELSDEERMYASFDTSFIFERAELDKIPAQRAKVTNVDTTPPYRKVRALRLYGSPQSPKTLLKQSELSTVEVKNRTKTRLFTAKSEIVSEKNQNLQQILRNSFTFRSPRLETNINPFYKSEVFATSSGKRRREGGLFGASPNESADKLSYNEFEDEFQPSKRINLRDRDRYLSRYENEFQEIREIGSGMFGSVFQCVNRLDGCVYAIKKSRKPLKGTSDERTALNEVYAHAVLGHHEHVVRYYSAWAENDHMLIQNEYCNGGSLAQAIENKAQQKEQFSETEVKHILLHIALGLRYIHSLVLAHMDIKPANIFITKTKRYADTPISDHGYEEGEEDAEAKEEEYLVYKIGDLGHVTSVSNPEVEEGDCRYMPGELLQDDYRHLPKADIFALGLTIYEVCGGGPLPKNGTEWHSIREGHLPYLSSYSKDLNNLLKQMIHPNPEQRPTSAALTNNHTLVPYACKTKEQLNNELNLEKHKNEVLSKQLELASQFCQHKDNRLKRLIGGKVNRSSSVQHF